MSFPIFINKRIFWETRLEDIDLQKHKNFVITRVFEWADLNELKALLKYFSNNDIVHALIKQKYLSKRTHQFASAILDIPKEDFAYYTQRQVHPDDIIPLKSLTDFDGAEEQTTPIVLNSKDWETFKTIIIKAVKQHVENDQPE